MSKATNACRRFLLSLPFSATQTLITQSYQSTGPCFPLSMAPWLTRGMRSLLTLSYLPAITSPGGRTTRWLDCSHDINCHNFQNFLKEVGTNWLRNWGQTKTIKMTQIRGNWCPISRWLPELSALLPHDVPSLHL